MAAQSPSEKVTIRPPRLVQGAKPARALPRRVLVVAPQPFYAPRGTPIAVRYVVTALRELGVEVDLLTFPLGERVDIDGVRILRAANPLGVNHVAVGFSPAKLALDASLFRDLVHLLRSGDYDVVHAIEEAAYFTALTPGLRRPPMIYDMASSIPDELRSVKVLGSSVVRPFLRYLERGVCRRSRFVICSAGLASTVVSAGKNIPFAEWRFPAMRPSAAPGAVAELRARLGLAPEMRVVLYAGTFAAYQGLELLLGGVKDLLASEPDVAVVCVGAGKEEEITAARRTLGLVDETRAFLLPRVPRNELDAFFVMADVLVSCRGKGLNSPLKVFDYLAVGKPIIANDVPAHRAVLDETTAILVDSNPSAFNEGILRVLREPFIAARLAAACRTYADAHLSWPSFVNLIRNAYEIAARPY